MIAAELVGHACSAMYSQLVVVYAKHYGLQVHTLATNHLFQVSLFNFGEVSGQFGQAKVLF